MKYHIYKQGKSISIEIESKAINSGGEGKIYRIISPYDYHDYCVKIYNEQAHAVRNQNKIEYMVLNAPNNIDMHNIRICWPKHSLFDNQGNFVGFVMRLAFPHSRDLKILSIYHIGKTIEEKYPKHHDWHHRFELTSSKGVLNRIKMIHNWALAVEIIHETRKYVLVDVKPDNVLATADGRISIVDTDSFQINDTVNVYRGPVATPEYFSKFAKIIERQNKLQTEDCDNFALAVSFYKILIGSHPYSGFRLKPPYNTDEYADIASHIDAELFAFGNKTNYIEFLTSNNMHERFHSLPYLLRRMFDIAFTQQRNLPKASEWRHAFRQILNGQGNLKSNTIVKFDSTNNLEMKCLCVLVIDVSGSMNLCINSLNASIDKFIRDLRDGKSEFNECSKDTIELAIIQFDRDVKILMSPTLINEQTPIPILTVRGLTTNTFDALDAAIKIVEDRKYDYKQHGISYYRPWIVLLTDGNPNPLKIEQLNTYSAKITDDISNQKYTLTAIGIGEKIDKNILSMLSNGNYSVIDKSGFSKLFQFLSASLCVTNNNPQDDLLGHLEDSFSISL